MNGSQFVREARRRAGLSQADVAGRAGTTQSAIARLESGRSAPSLERVAELVRACGFELDVHLTPADDSDWSIAQGNLRLGIESRLRQHAAAVRFARAGRRALADARA
ncbi:MAG: helix-turn-helix transcriptional regulator [Actinomycetota bacterium]